MKKCPEKFCRVKFIVVQDNFGTLKFQDINDNILFESKIECDPDFPIKEEIVKFFVKFSDASGYYYLMLPSEY